MIVYLNGYYETGDWQTADTYPDKEYKIIDESTAEGAALAAKVIATQPCALVLEDGYIVDVIPRDKTPDEIAAEEEQKTPDQIRIEQLENESALLAMELIDTQITLEQTQSEQAALLLALIDGGVL